MDANLAIEYISVEEIKPYTGNARKHEKKDISAIVNSIEQFGFDDPIGIWSDENIIVEGHGRLEAAKQLGMKEVPCIRLDHLNDEQRRAYSLAHNRTAELSEWDLGLLDIELGDIFNLDMSDFGFDMELEPSDDEIDDGGIEDKEKSPVAVKIVFENTKAWRRVENKVRIFCDSLENVSLSVGEYDDED